MDGGLDEEAVGGEAGIALVAVGVEDPEVGPPPRRAEAVPGDHRLRPLADDVASEPDPRPSGELESEAGRLRDGRPEGAGSAGWLEEDEQRARPPGERGEAMESIRHPRDLRSGGQPGR